MNEEEGKQIKEQIENEKQKESNPHYHVTNNGVFEKGEQFYANDIALSI